MPEQAALQYYRYRISRDPKRLIAWFGDNWSHNRKLRVLSYLGGFAVVAFALGAPLVYGQARRLGSHVEQATAAASAAARDCEIEVVDVVRVRVEILLEGTGPAAARGQEVVVHYTGRLADGGKQFDSSRDSDHPFRFRLGVHIGLESRRR